MSTQGIQLADLSHILRALSDLNSGLQTVQGGVSNLDSQLQTTQGELAKLSQSFAVFVADDARAKEVQLAETRQVKVRQELETKYGHYATIRRHATGILQAADLSLVRQETIAYATEELMLRAPGYWLAPSLVALSAWLRDDRELAVKAVQEASRRDDEKTSLFLALVGRRSARVEVCKQWLDRYFGMQDPYALDRQTVVLVDALASGVFGVEVRQTCSTRLATWVNELSQQPNFVAGQRKQWAEALLSKVPTQDHSSAFPYLAKNSPTWDALQAALNGAQAHAAILAHFNGIFEGHIQPSPSLEAAVDELLTKLVSNFDDEELPLRRTDRELELIIENGGDRAAAKAKWSLESSALDERVSFTQLLTNAAMHAQTSHASLATQRLAISVSRTWIKEAYADLLAALRQKVPTGITIEIEAWQGETTDGANETELLGSMGSHFDGLKAQKLEQLNFGTGHWFGVVCGVALLFMSFLSPFWGFVGVVTLICLFTTYTKINAARQKVEEDHATFVASCEGILKACLSEVVEWRREHLKHDAVSVQVSALFERLAPSQHMQTTHDSARQISA